MCTAISYKNGSSHFFGRNLDLEIEYPASTVITPRNYEFELRNMPHIKEHYALIGTGMVIDNTPLYFEAMNEKGLGMAGLAFFKFGYYPPVTEGKDNVASFEFIPYILSQCGSVEESRKLLENINIDNTGFSESLPPQALHWIISDEKESIVIETTKEKGLKVYDNPFNCLTNPPTFDYMLWNMSYYINLSGDLVPVRFADDKDGLVEYSRGIGSIGLPGGVDSISRFVRAVFTLRNSKSADEPLKNVAEFFHILSNVQQVSGEDEVKPGEYEITLYTAGGDTKTGVWYHSTYYNPTIYAVDMKKEDLDGKTLVVYPFKKDFVIPFDN